MGASARRFDIAEAGLGVLAEAFPLETVQAILAATGREGKRKRLLPASMMVYYVIALGLFVGVGCREVLRRLQRCGSGRTRFGWRPNRRSHKRGNDWVPSR